MSLVAVLDADVLYSAPLRHLLIWLGVSDACRARWTETIQDEWTRALLRDRPDIHPARIARTRHLMDQHIADAVIIGYEHLIVGLSLPDPDDRHVLAAAIHGRATAIGTRNLEDFPTSALAPHGIRAMHPDNFICSLIEMGIDAVVAAACAHRADLKKPPRSPAEYLAALEQHGLIRTAATLRPIADRL